MDSDNRPLRKERETFKGTVRKLIPSDIPLLKPILETHLRDSESQEVWDDDVSEAIVAMTDAAQEGYGGDRYYSVALDERGAVIGVMGLKSPDSSMKEYKATPDSRPAEVINAYVAANKLRSDSSTGSGVGTALLNSLKKVAQDREYTEMIVNSGQAFKDTGGHRFWNKNGDQIGSLLNYYGPGSHAPVWRINNYPPAK